MSVLSSRFSILANPRVVPIAFTNVTLNQNAHIYTENQSPTIADILIARSEHKLKHTSSQLKLQLQWSSAFKIQIQVVRNAVVCCVCAVMANGAFYIGNIFAFRSSVDQTLPEFTMAMLVWMAITYAVIMLIAHVPSLMTQKFIERPNTRPSFWFCAKKLMKKSWIAFAATLTGMIAVGFLVQNTSLMHKYFRLRLHFYLAVVNNLTFTAGITLAVRRIYFEETCQGRDRRCGLKNGLNPQNSTSRNATQRVSKALRSKYRTPSYWREYFNQLPNALLIAMAGGYVHAVLTWWQKIQEQASVMAFAVFGIVLKLALQEAARHYVLKKNIRSTRTMCILVGVPTVLIDTQSRIVMLGTQTNTFWVSGTIALAVAEIALRATKAAFVVWTTRGRSRAMENELLTRSSGSRSPASVELEFELWRRQVIAYHTAELTADMYAEYVAIGCSQSIVFWWFGHPLYPVLRIDGAGTLSELDISRLRFNQVALLGFQSFVEIFVDYVCIVMEMAAGIEFDRIEGISTFLGALFVTMAVVNINISSGVYLG